MFVRIVVFAFAILPVLGGVTVSLAARDTCDGGESGTLLCCSFLASADDPVVAPILASLGIVPGSLDDPVGVTCAPLDDSNQPCAGQRACCVNNSFNGVVALECTQA